MSLEPQTKVILTVIEGPEAGKAFGFTEQDNFLLGRNAEGSHAHFRLSPEDRYVSRDHFLLEINPPDGYLRDAGSKNGTYIVRQSGEKTVFFLEGREERQWTGAAKDLVRSYRCESYQEAEGKIKLEDGDLIKVGDTIVAVKIVQEDPEATKEAPIGGKEAQPEEVFSCVRCGRDITSEVLAKKAEKLTSNDFICEECHKKQQEKPTPMEATKCWGCSRDLTSLANSDFRAEELKDIALYWCESCAFSKKEKVPISRIEDYHILKELGSGGFGVIET